MKNLKCFVDRKGCDRKHSRQIWSNVWIIKDDRGGCHDQIWRDIWIGTDDIACCIDQIKCCEDLILCDRKHSWPFWCTMGISTVDRGWCLELILKSSVDLIRCFQMLSWPNFNCSVDWNVCDRKLSRPIWRTMWIISIDKGWCYDLNWGTLWIGTDSEIRLSWPNM
jgi:hypothetical protein